ncbi:MAG: phenylalanine--tRNA ligase subunit alpha, partial [bacterium]
MQEKLKALEGEARGAIEEAASLEEVEGLRVRYLGRKGKLTLILRAMKDLPAAERPVVGKLANEIRARLEDLLQERRSALVESQKEERLEKERIDVTMPGARPRMGNKHPLTLVL